MLRVAALPLNAPPDEWPTLAEVGSSRSWLRATWKLPGFAAAVRYTSASFADVVEAVIAGEITGGKQVRRATLAAMRYLLRAVGRPTPFGLFAGVAPVQVGGAPSATWGAAHRAMIRVDTLWLDVSPLFGGPDNAPTR